MIKEKGNINSIVRGQIVAGYRDVFTSKFTPVIEQKNLVTYGGADIMARLMSGDIKYSINGMYFKYENTAETPVATAPLRENTVGEQYHTLTGVDYIDWLRVPIITTGKIAALPSGSHYSGNSVTFVATTASVSTTGSTAEENIFSSDENSKIFSVALVAMPDFSSFTSDIAFSMATLTSAIPAVANSYIDVFWTISFT